MSLSGSINVHRTATLAAAALSVVTSLCFLVMPNGWRGAALRDVLHAIAMLSSSASTLALLISAIAFVLLVGLSPDGSGTGQRFVIAVGSVVLAAVLFVNGTREWGGLSGPTVLAIAVLSIIAFVATAMLWTGLARHAGNHQLADDIRTAFVFLVVGGIANGLLARTGQPVLMFLGHVLTLPGSVLLFKTQGALARQFRSGHAWSS